MQSDWKTIDIWPWAEDAELRYNHYPFLSKDYVRRKSQENRNPFLASWNDETDDFFNTERDTEILAYLPELKDRMWRAIEENPPIHPDDWRPHEHMD
jgi:hypothetical protein